MCVCLLGLYNCVSVCVCACVCVCAYVFSSQLSHVWGVCTVCVHAELCDVCGSPQVKFSELTVDMFRMLQALEREPVNLATQTSKTGTLVRALEHSTPHRSLSLSLSLTLFSQGLSLSLSLFLSLSLSPLSFPL